MQPEKLISDTDVRSDLHWIDNKVPVLTLTPNPDLLMRFKTQFVYERQDQVMRFKTNNLAVEDISAIIVGLWSRLPRAEQEAVIAILDTRLDSDDEFSPLEKAIRELALGEGLADG